MTDTTTPVPAVGDFVTARPWAGGRELEPQGGLILGQEDGGEYATVWFCAIGTACSEQSGKAIQAILNCKIELTGANAADLKRRPLMVLYRAIAPAAGQPPYHAVAALHALLYPIARAVTERN